MNEARGVTGSEKGIVLPPYPCGKLHNSEFWDEGIEWAVAGERAARMERERQLLASLEREAELQRNTLYMHSEHREHIKELGDRIVAVEAQLAAAQNSGLPGFEEWLKHNYPEVAIRNNASSREKALAMYVAWQAATAAQAAIALTRENEQSAIDAAAVEERFELRERLKVTERALEMTCEFPEHWIAAARAELAKEKANG